MHGVSHSLAASSISITLLTFWGWLPTISLVLSTIAAALSIGMTLYNIFKKGQPDD